MTAPSNASVRDHVRLVLEKLKSHQKERTSTAAEDKKVNPDRAEDNSRKVAFAERLKAAIERRGWSLTETARQTASVLGTDAKFGRANLSHYLHGRSMPRARQLLALSHALGVRPDDLFPAGSLSRVEVISGTPTGIHALDQGDGTVTLEVSQRVPWQTALEVMRLLKLPSDGSSSEGQWHRDRGRTPR
jgi:transcriptional regulator with XRE-family HTH domain